MWVASVFDTFRDPHNPEGLAVTDQVFFYQAGAKHRTYRWGKRTVLMEFDESRFERPQ